MIDEVDSIVNKEPVVEQIELTKAPDSAYAMMRNEWVKADKYSESIIYGTISE